MRTTRGHSRLTVGQQTPAELVEGGKGEERAVGVRLLQQHRDFLSPGEQQPPDRPTQRVTASALKKLRRAVV